MNLFMTYEEIERVANPTGEDSVVEQAELDSDVPSQSQKTLNSENHFKSREPV